MAAIFSVAALGAGGCDGAVSAGREGVSTFSGGLGLSGDDLARGGAEGSLGLPFIRPKISRPARLTTTPAITMNALGGMPSIYSENSATMSQ